MFLKKILYLLLILSFSSSLYCVDKNQDATDDKNGKIKMTNLEIFRIAYWSTYGTIGLTSIAASLGEMGNAYSISNEITGIASDLDRYNANTATLRNFATYYPGIVFGLNFLSAGYAFIPVAGGIVYGASMYTAAITLCVLSSLNIFAVNITAFGNVPNVSAYEQRLKSAYDKIFDPTSYFVVGSVSILLGVADIILWIYYNREIKRSKFPYNQRRFAFSPGSLSFTIYL